MALFFPAMLWLSACGRLQPLPSAWEPELYKSIAYEELLNPGPAGLTSGQKVKVPVYFWQFLTYDPALIPNYLTLARHPLKWSRLSWFATYGTPNMEGYFDRLVMNAAQRESYPLKRLEHLLVYGELVDMGFNLLYLQVHHLDRITED